MLMDGCELSSTLAEFASVGLKTVSTLYWQISMQFGEFNSARHQFSLGQGKNLTADLWQIPVVKGDPGLNACCQQAVNDRVVEVQASLIRGPGATGLDAGPGYRHAERLDPQPLHHVDILQQTTTE